MSVTKPNRRNPAPRGPTVTRIPAWVVLIILAVCLLPGIGRADSVDYKITGGFTSFSGNVGGSAAPNYIRALTIPPPGVDCGVINCSDPLLFYGEVCPDLGCSAASGVATNYSLLSGSSPTNDLTFKSFGCTPSQPVCGNPANELDFVPSNLSIIGFNQNLGYSELLLGSLTFTNGTWTGNADFGLTITATDAFAPHNAYTFNGLLHMAVNTHQPGITDPAVITQQDADCISLENSAGQPLADPQTKILVGSFCAYEPGNPLGLSDTFTVNLYGRLGSLDPTRFDVAAGDGFIVGGPAGSAVPEPGSWSMAGAGLLLAVAISRRARAC